MSTYILKKGETVSSTCSDCYFFRYKMHETRGYETARGGYLGHIHVKDVQVDTPSATLQVCCMGKGQLAKQYGQISKALRDHEYKGVISYESVYHPGNGNFEDGFRLCVHEFKRLFA